MPLEWVATEIRTGAVIESLPNLQVDSVKDVIGDYNTATGTLPLRRAPQSWLRATKPRATVLNLVDTTADVCVWGGFITRRVRSEADTVQLSMATMPAYFDRRFITADTPYTNVGQNGIVADLVTRFVATGNGKLPGLPIRVVNLDGAAGRLRTRTEYLDSADKSIYSVLKALMGVNGGPEWYVGWEKTQLDDGRLAWTPVLYVGARIGVAKPAGLAPAVTFELPGPATAMQLTEDYSSDSGANDVMAVSTATADQRPQSSHHTIDDDGESIVFERRFTPSTSITDDALLDDYAEAELQRVKDGSVELDMTALNRVGSALGVDWGIGDDIGFKIGDANDPAREVPAFPGGQSGVQRAWGWEVQLGDPVTVTPTLVSPVTEVEDDGS